MRPTRAKLGHAQPQLVGEVLAGALRQRAQLGVVVDLVLRGPAAGRDDRKILADQLQITGAHAHMVARPGRIACDTSLYRQRPGQESPENLRR
jgi:hypothetical protein